MIHLEKSSSENKNRICNTCGKELPLTKDNFIYNPTYGFTHICLDCYRNKRKTNALNKENNKKTNNLKSYTPRELMLELKRRGFEGELIYTEVHKITLQNLN